MTKKALKPIAGQKTLFGTVIKPAPTWKCGATYNQEFPIFRNVQRESKYLSFVNAFARSLDRSAHSLQEAKIICDNDWKRVKTDQSIVEQVVSATDFLECNLQCQETQFQTTNSSTATTTKSRVSSSKCRVEQLPIGPSSCNCHLRK